MTDELTYEELVQRITELEKNERQQSEEVMRDSGQTFRRFAENSLDMIYRMSLPDGKYEYISPASTTIFGYSPKEWYDNPLLIRRIIHEDFDSYFEHQWEDLLKGIISPTYEYKIIHKDGKLRWVNQRNILVKDGDGQLVALEGVVTDITERKQVEEALVVSEARLRDIISSICDWVWEIDKNGVYTYSSHHGFNLLGRSRGDIVGKTPFDFMSPEEAGRVAAILTEIAANKAPIKNLENWNIGENGKRICLLTNGVPMLDAEGNLKGYRGVDKDITEHKLAEENLRSKDKQLAEITSRLPCLVFQFVAGWDGSRTVSYLNGQVEKILGLDSDLQGFFERFTAAVLIDQRSDFINTVEKTVRNVAEWKYEGPIAKPSGEIVWISGIASPTKTSEGIFYDGVIVDITERKQTSEILRESEAKYHSAYTMMRMLCDNVPDMIWAKDLEKRYLFANKAICANLLGAADTNEPIGKMDMFFAERERTQHADNPQWHTFGEICRDTDAITMEAGAAQQFDEYGNVQGKFLFLDVHKAPFIGEDGRMIGTVGSARDVTTTKEMERRLLNKEALLQAMLRNLPFDFWARDKNDHIIIQSNKSLDLWGDLIQNPMAEKQFDEKTLELWKSNNRRVLAGEIVSEESTLVTRNGEPRQIHNIVVPILNEAETLGLLGINIDITDRKQAEEALRESEQRYREYVENTPFGVFVTNEQGQYLQVNPAACRITGYTEKELLAMSIPDLLFKETLAEDMLHFQTLVREGKSQCEIRFCPKNGEKRWWSVTAVKISDKRFLGFCNDISDRKFAEEERANLEAENRQLQKAESLGLMAGAIAHHINNQLGAVIGNLEMTLEDLPQGSEMVKSLTSAMKASRQAAEIGSQMLTYLGKSTGIRKLLDLSETCRQSLPLLQTAVPHGLIFKVDLPSPGPTINANANQLQQVLTNLVTNAWEAIADNKGTLGLTVKMASPAEKSAANKFPSGWQPEDGTPYACLEVIDTGCGISREYIEKIFDPFFSTKFTGRGLGLPVVLGIVKTHHGAVTVESTLGRGSSFRVLLPMSAGEIPGQLQKTVQPLATEGSGTVLLVDDEEILREMAATMIARLGYTVLEAKNGIEAVELFRLHQDEIRCVLSDVTMPHMDGWETLAALRKLSPDIPVILSSGYDEAQVIRGDQPERPQAFLHKPYMKTELKEVLAKTITS